MAEPGSSAAASNVKQTLKMSLEPTRSRPEERNIIRKKKAVKYVSVR